MARQPPRRTGSAPAKPNIRRRPADKQKPSDKKKTGLRQQNAAIEPAGKFEEVAERAARLGITPERVLEEYAHIAFADLSHIASWGPGGLTVKPSEQVEPTDTAAISEITGPAEGRGAVRVKLYDKKAALDAIARHLGMFPPPLQRHDTAAPEPEEDPLEEIQRMLARLAAEDGEGPAAVPDDPRGATGPEA